MQTLDRHDQFESATPPGPSKRRKPIVIGLASAVALAAVTGLIAYSVGSSGTKTKTVVEVVPPKVSTGTPAAPAAAAAKAPACIPGAAAGSCNTDEAAVALIPDKPLPPKTRAIEAAQLVAARQAAMKYPTVADATKAGFILAGGFSPLTGAHYVDMAHAAGGPFDPSHPGSYIYDGTHPTSKIIGLMYLGSDVNPPAGFAGPNDHWHRHSNTCVIFGSGNSIKVPFPADSSVTKTQCDNVNGTFMRRTTWMVHAWVVPGWESPSGVFAHDNKDVVCADGTTKANSAGFCTGT